MSQNFSSPTWIDHGNNNGPENNREDLICDATVKGSPFYSVDKWGKNGIRYLHNAYYEEMNTFQNWQFPSSLEKPFSGYGDFFPKPDYYQHNSLTNNLFHWSTSSVLFINDPNPTAVLLIPVVFPCIAFLPKLTLFSPVVLLYILWKPTAVFPHFKFLNSE